MPRHGKIKGQYQKQYRYDVCCNQEGVPGECIAWCEDNCNGAWGWWFETTQEWHINWNPEHNTAYVSFSRKKDATRFWFENVKILEESKRNN